MKKFKLFFTIGLMLLMTSLYSQNAITITAPNPAYQPVNAWPGGNSWNMTTALYNDVVNLNAATVNVSNANTFTATQTFNAINVTTIGATTVSAGVVINGLRATVINDSALTSVTLTAAQSGARVMLKALAGDTIVLPASSTANIGVTFTVEIAYSATSVGHTIKTSSSDVFYGGVIAVSTTTASMFASTANKTMQLSTTTTGGLKGTVLTFTLISGARWAVTGNLMCSGSVATPFAN